MTGQVQAQGVFFTLETFLERQFLGLAMVAVDVGVFLDEQPAKQVGVAAVVGTSGLFGGLDRFFHRRQQHRAVAVDVGLVGLRLVVEVRAQPVQGTTADQTVEVRLLMRLRSTRAQKSNRSLNGPSWRASVMASTGPSPTPLIAPRP